MCQCFSLERHRLFGGLFWLAHLTVALVAVVALDRIADAAVRDVCTTAGYQPRQRLNNVVCLRVCLALSLPPSLSLSRSLAHSRFLSLRQPRPRPIIAVSLSLPASLSPPLPSLPLSFSLSLSFSLTLALSLSLSAATTPHQRGGCVSVALPLSDHASSPRSTLPEWVWRDSTFRQVGGGAGGRGWGSGTVYWSKGEQTDADVVPDLLLGPFGEIAALAARQVQDGVLGPHL